MDISDIVLSNSMQFASLTAEVVDKLLELINSLMCTSKESKEFREFLNAEKKFLETHKDEWNVGEHSTYLYCDKLDAKALSAKFEEAGIPFHVMYNPTDISNGNILTTGSFIFKNEYLEQAKNCMIKYAREVVGCTHVPINELLKKGQETTELYKVNNVSYTDLLAIQNLAKANGREFYFSSVLNNTNNNFEIYCSSKDAAKLNVALAEISMSRNYYNGRTIDSNSDVGAKGDVIKDFIERVQKGEDLCMYNSDNSSLKISVSDGLFTVYENEKAIFKPSKELFNNDKQKYYTELLRYVKNFNKPVFLNGEEMNSENLQKLIQQKSVELYPAIPEAADDFQQAKVILDKMAKDNIAFTNYADFSAVVDTYISKFIENSDEIENVKNTINKFVDFKGRTTERVQIKSDEIENLKEFDLDTIYNDIRNVSEEKDNRDAWPQL